MVKSGLRASGKWSLKYKQTPPLRKLEGWSQGKSLYPSVASLRSSEEIEESKKVSVRQRYQIDTHLKRLKFARVWKSYLPIYAKLGSNKRFIKNTPFSKETRMQFLFLSYLILF